MAITRTQLYRSSLALFVWLQEFEKCMSAKYDLDLPEMDYLASNLTPRECYDFYRLLSHRRIDRGEDSIYAVKAKNRAIPCASLLAAWLTDPDESSFRSHENIELKLRKIGRKDLARWILGKIDYLLQRRQLDVIEADYRRIEESEKSGVNVRNRIGERIMPSVSLNDHQTGMKNEDISEDVRTTSCYFWKIFFSVVIIIFLSLLFLYFYRFLYTKLRCICRRFVDSENGKRYLPEQTYGTTCRLNFPEKNTTNSRHFSKSSAYNNRATTQDRTGDTISKYNFSSANEANEDTISSDIEEKRALLLNLACSLTNRKSSRENNIFFPIQRNDEISMKPKFDQTSNFEKSSSSSLSKIAKKITKSLRSKRNCVDSSSDGNLTRLVGTRKKEKKSTRSLSNDELRTRLSSCTASLSKKSHEATEQHTTGERPRSRNLFVKTKNSENLAIPKWTSCSCNLIADSSKKYCANSSDVSSPRGKKIENSEIERFDEFSRSLDDGEYNRDSPDDEAMKNVRQVESITELSETYDELGMLFSQHMKLQSRPCRRKYCPVARNLRAQTVRTIEHDERKCRTMSRANFNVRVLDADQRPACSTGNICNETYDEFELMRAMGKQRETLTRTIVERRKSFLEQPCVSPTATKRSNT